MPQRTLLRRLARAAVATTAVALATSTLAPPASAADERDRDRSAAAGWLVSELTDDHLYNTEFESVDWGLTVDALFALAADGTRPRVTARLGREIRDHVDDYTTYKGDVSAGAAGKILVAAEVLDADMASFGGHDLRRDLLQLVDDGGADQGRITDSAKTDYSNVITQSYGVIGLSRSGSTPRSTVQFLLKQRCADGSFRLDMTTDGTCEQDGSAADVDATAFAVQALVAADRRGGVSVRDRVITDTGRWLADAQRRNGGFGGGAATQAPNANSAGVAAQALSITGHDEAVRRARRFVSGLQITAAKADGGPARSDLGAIALDRDALRTALRQGITTKTSDPFRRATTQAVFALEPVSLVDLSTQAAAPAPAGEGLAGSCPTSSGTTVVVDFTALGGDVVVRCVSSSPKNGLAALEAAQFDPDGTARYGDAFVCRVAGRPGGEETLTVQGAPDGYREQCQQTPPQNAYWGYWQARNGGSWAFSNTGASSSKPIPGGFEGWSFQLNRAGKAPVPPQVSPQRRSPSASGGANSGDPSDPSDPSGDAEVTSELPDEPAVDDGSALATAFGVGLLALLGAGAGVTAWRRRRA